MTNEEMWTLVSYIHNNGHPFSPCQRLGCDCRICAERSRIYYSISQFLKDQRSLGPIFAILSNRKAIPLLEDFGL